MRGEERRGMEDVLPSRRMPFPSWCYYLLLTYMVCFQDPFCRDETEEHHSAGAKKALG